MDGSIPIIGRKICDICGKQAHPFNTKCRYEDLIERVKKLLEANRHIPAILEAHTEAVNTARAFDKLAQDTSTAMFLVEKVVMQFDNGPQIWKRFQEELEKRWVPTSSRDTAEAQTSSPENTTPSETPSKPSTGETPPGVIIARDSSRLIESATRAENQRPSSIIYDPTKET